MNKQSIIYLSATALVLITLAGVFYYLRKDFWLEFKGTGSFLGTTSTSSNVSNAGGYIIEPVPLINGPKMPDINRKIAVSANLDEISKTALFQGLAKAREALSKDSSSMENWIVYGNQLKMMGDYRGALEVYDYISVLRPQNIVSFSNAGDIWHYYLKDYVQAEKNLKKVVTNDSFYEVGYRNLFDLYNLSYKTNTPLAEDTLKEGIKNLPESINLPALLGSYYANKGREGDSRFYYELALKNAKNAGDELAVRRLEEELGL